MILINYTLSCTEIALQFFKRKTAKTHFYKWGEVLIEVGMLIVYMLQGVLVVVGIMASDLG